MLRGRDFNEYWNFFSSNLSVTRLQYYYSFVTKKIRDSVTRLLILLKRQLGDNNSSQQLPFVPHLSSNRLFRLLQHLQIGELEDDQQQFNGALQQVTTTPNGNGLGQPHQPVPALEPPLALLVSPYPTLLRHQKQEEMRPH